MKVVCRATTLSAEQLAELGRPLTSQYDFGEVLVVGREYLVLGMAFQVDVEGIEIGAFVLLEVATRQVASVPLALFEITDPRVSRSWVARSESADLVALAPESLLGEGFLAQLADGEPVTSAAFDKVTAQLRAEANDA